MDDELELGYLLAVSAAAVWTPRPLVALLSALGSARAIVEYARTMPTEPVGCEPLGREAINRLAAIDDGVARNALDDGRSDEHCFITSKDPEYPRRLHDLCDPPPVLYYRGCLKTLCGRAIAIVGSRAATPYGRSMAGSIAGDFAAFGATIISGLARGIDAAAHRGAMRGDVPTVAVIGSGLQALYPTYHRQLADEIIAKGGAIVSEFPPKMAAQPYQFPMRNRVVAALADATVVVEANSKSGALITARLAAELGRAVFALPGDVGRPTSEGTNGLIKDGVPLTTGAADVAEVLGWSVVLSPTTLAASGNSLLSVLAPGGSDIDEVCVKTGLDISTVAAQLTILEVQGLVERHAGGLYCAVRAARAPL